MERDTNMYSAEENAKKLEELENRVKRLEEFIFTDCKISNSQATVKQEPILVFSKGKGEVVYND